MLLQKVKEKIKQYNDKDPIQDALDLEKKHSKEIINNNYNAITNTDSFKKMQPYLQQMVSIQKELYKNYLAKLPLDKQLMQKYNSLNNTAWKIDKKFHSDLEADYSVIKKLGFIFPFDFVYEILNKYKI